MERCSSVVTFVFGHRAALRLTMRAPQYPQNFLGLRSQTLPSFRSNLVCVICQGKQDGHGLGHDHRR